MNLSKYFGHLGHFPTSWKQTWSHSAVLVSHQFRAYFIESLVAFSLALATYLFLVPLAYGSNFLSAVAGTSSLLFVVFLIESPTLPRRLLNLFAIPLIFACAHASLNGAAVMLIVAFLLQALVAAIQMSGQQEERKAQLFCWTVYNLSLALLLL